MNSEEDLLQDIFTHQSDGINTSEKWKDKSVKFVAKQRDAVNNACSVR